MSTHNLCFEQKYEKLSDFLSENFQFLVLKFSVYLNRRVLLCVMGPEKSDQGSQHPLTDSFGQTALLPLRKQTYSNI